MTIRAKRIIGILMILLFVIGVVFIPLVLEYGLLKISIATVVILLAAAWIVIGVALIVGDG